MEPIDESLIFCYIVSGVKVEADGVAELVFLRRRENDARVASHLAVGLVEIHGPIFWILYLGRRMCHSAMKSLRASNLIAVLGT